MRAVFFRAGLLVGPFAWLLAGQAAWADVRYVDMSSALPVEHVYSGGWEHFVGGGVSVFDCNNDRRPDIFAAGGAGSSHMFVNLTEGASEAFRFAEAKRFPDLVGVTGAYPLDINDDGLLDLVVLRVGQNLLLRGLGECRFEDATDQSGIEMSDRWTTAFSATWEEANRLPTLAFGNYVDRSDPDGPFEACDVNEVYRPEARGYGAALELAPGFCALSMLFSDWNRSGRQDLRVSNDRHYYVRGGTEQMWRMDATPELLGPKDGWEKISIWGMGIASRDLNGDARPDLVLTSMADQLMLLSQNETDYVTAPYDMGAAAQRPHTGEDGRPSTGWSAVFGDVNNDGRDDLFIAKGNVDQMPSNAMHDPNNLLIRQPDGRFVEQAVEAGVATDARSRGAALADLNGDGLLDLVVVNRRAPMELYRNASTATGNWLAVAPRQVGVNDHAVGAWLELRLPDGSVVAREITVGGAHVSGVDGPQHFGLGSVETADVRVIWPDGAVSDWSTVDGNATYDAWRGEGAALDVRAQH